MGFNQGPRAICALRHAKKKLSFDFRTQDKFLRTITHYERSSVKSSSRKTPKSLATLPWINVIEMSLMLTPVPPVDSRWQWTFHNLEVYHKNKIWTLKHNSFKIIRLSSPCTSCKSRFGSQVQSGLEIKIRNSNRKLYWCISWNQNRHKGADTSSFRVIRL